MKCGNGLKRIGILLLLLVLAVGSLSAWDFGGGLFKKKSASPAEPVAQTQLEAQLLVELQTELDGLKQIISNSQATIAKQTAELIALKASSSVFAVNHETLKGEYDALKIAYEALVNQPTVTNYESPWGGVIGGGATYSLDGKIGAEILGGVSFKNVTWTTGVEWKPMKFEFVIPKVDDLIFKTGLQYRF